MPHKVKRGLGLLVVALVALLIGRVLVANEAPQVALWLPSLLFLGCGGLGLVLLVWGLLRD